MPWSMSTSMPKAAEMLAWPWRLGTPTLGGLQFWADVHLFRDWRIQQNVHSGRHRLLDGANFQHASGSYQDCKNLLDLVRVRHGLSPWLGEAVILIHGLIRTRNCMNVMADHLRASGFRVYTVGYPSLQTSIGSHARDLHRIIADLDGADPIHLVGFSMGGLVARACLEIGRDPRVKRLVTVGTPHQGADKAALLQRIGILRWIGPAAMQLVPGADGIVHQLASNPAEATGVEVGIIAGGGPGGRGYSMTIPPDNDGVVTVASTLLPGASDFQLVRGIHAFLPSLLSVRKATVRFLRIGCFRSPTERRAIESVHWLGQDHRRAVVAGWRTAG